MKKAAKKKSPAKKSAKKSAKKVMKATSRTKGILVKAAKKTKAAVMPKKKAAPAATLTFTELFEMKQQQDQSQEPANTQQTIPPHELHDKVNLQPKPQSASKVMRSGASGTRHK